MEWRFYFFVVNYFKAVFSIKFECIIKIWTQSEGWIELFHAASNILIISNIALSKLLIGCPDLQQEQGH